MSIQYETTIPDSSIGTGDTYTETLMGLHTARRLLISRINDANGEGVSTALLERALSENRSAARDLLASLEAVSNPRSH